MGVRGMVTVSRSSGSGADHVHGDTSDGLWDYHYTSDPLIRYLRDRRLHRALKDSTSAES
jgi:hypothetical protein